MTRTDGREDGGVQPRPPRVPTRVFPLNSKRLTGQHVMSIAKELDVPTRGTVDVRKVMIEVNLAEVSRDPRAVQAEVIEGEGGRVAINLRDSHGAFMEADCSTSDNRVEGTRVFSRDQDDVDEVSSEFEIQSTKMNLLYWLKFRIRIDSCISLTTSLPLK